MGLLLCVEREGGEATRAQCASDQSKNYLSEKPTVRLSHSFTSPRGAAPL